MKTIVQLIMFLISIATFSQDNLNGNYCRALGEGNSTCIDFKDNGTFEYVVSGCLGTEAFGRGKFELKNETLNLKFDNAKQVQKSKFHIAEVNTISEKKIRLEFKIKDEYGIELPANVIRTSDRKYFLFDELNRVFKVDKNSPKAKYRIEFIGYETLELEIDNKNDKVIDIILFPAQPRIISNKKISMTWEKINEKEFKTGTNSWDKFKK